MNIEKEALVFLKNLKCQMFNVKDKMSLREKQQQMYDRHSQEVEDFFSETIKEFAKANMDFIASGNSFGNDEGGTSEYKEFSAIKKNQENKFLDEEQLNSFIDVLNQELETKGLDVDLSSLLEDYIFCGYDENVFFLIKTLDSGEIEVKELDYQDIYLEDDEGRTEENATLFETLLGCQR